MNEDNYLKESIKDCVDFAMQQDDETKRDIFTGLFIYVDSLINESILIKTLNDEENKKWFDNVMFKIKDQEIKRLNNIINEIEKYLLNHYEVGNEIQNEWVDDILDKLKELKENK